MLDHSKPIFYHKEMYASNNSKPKALEEDSKHELLKTNHSILGERGLYE